MNQRRAKCEPRRSAELTKRAGIGTSAALGATVLFAPAAEAATFTVSNLDDAGAGSLRQAVLDAETAAGADTIVFQSGLTGTITLTTGEITITEALDIQGPGANVITVSGNDASRIFYSQMAAGDGAEQPLSISGLTLRDGYSGTALGGGALYTDETLLTISNSVLTGNEAGNDGGAVYTSDGSFTLQSSVVSNNLAADYGGGIHVEDNDAADIVIRDSTISGNSAEEGGGLMLYDLNRGFGSPGIQNGALIERTTVSGNTATNLGGGIYVEDSYGGGGDVTIDASTISGNSAGSLGGGIGQFEDIEAPLTIRNSTVSGNSASVGGGIYLYNGDDLRFTIENSTVVNNSASAGSPGIYRYGDDEVATSVDTVVLSSTIVANNTGPGADLNDGPSPEGSFELGFSLVGSTGKAVVTETPVGSNLLGVDPLLGPLAANGGPTQTHLPALQSSALDAGVANGLATDQRGLARTFDAANIANRPGSDATDIGALERVAEGACKGKPATILFEPGQPIIGSDGNDVIVGTAAADQINAGAGKDTVCGGPGNDKLKGGAGKDALEGEAGKDKAKGGGGKDKLRGGGGKDRLSGQAGADKLKGQAGKDTLKGGSGKDTLKGGGGRDKLRGGPGRDKLNGGPGKDSERQ